MAAAESAPASKSNEREAVEKAVADSASKIAFFAALSCGIIVPVRGPMIYAMKKNDATAAAQALASMSAIAAAIEFLCNPVLGRLSDKYGRKPFIVASTSIIAALHSCVAAFPNSFRLCFINRCITGACIFCFFNPISASLRDVFAGNMEMMTMVGAKLGTAFGLGFAAGPLLGSQLAGAKGFMAGALGWATTSFLAATRYPETLAEKDKKEFDIFASNPLSFLRLLKNITMTKLVACVGCNSFAEYANIYDVNFLFLKSVLNYGQREVGLFATGYGVTQIGGGLLGGALIKKLGLSAYTKLGHAAYILGFGLLGSAKSFQQLSLALVALTFGHARCGEPDNVFADKAKAAGMGEGEIQGARANFLAIIKIFAPILFGRVFAWGNARKVSGLPYFLIAALVAAAQLIFTTVEKGKKSSS